MMSLKLFGTIIICIFFIISSLQYRKFIKKYNKELEVMRNCKHNFEIIKSQRIGLYNEIEDIMQMKCKKCGYIMGHNLNKFPGLFEMFH